MNSEHLEPLRNELEKAGTSEFWLATDNLAVQDLWQERQNLMAEMNQAIATAVRNIQAQYAERLRDADQQYAMYLQLVMPRTGDQS